MGFLNFLLRGNILDMAIAFIMGQAFNKLVTALTESFVTPLIGVFGGTPVFQNEYFEINSSRFTYGSFIDALLTFILTGTVVYFALVIPADYLKKMVMPPPAPGDRECPNCLSNIKKGANRCPFCTSTVEPVYSKDDVEGEGS